MSRSTGRVFLGHYESEIEAALVYDRAVLQHFGAQGFLNFPKLSPSLHF